jgi:hypothetical protein
VIEAISHIGDGARNPETIDDRRQGCRSTRAAPQRSKRSESCEIRAVRETLQTALNDTDAGVIARRPDHRPSGDFRTIHPLKRLVACR